MNGVCQWPLATIPVKWCASATTNLCSRVCHHALISRFAGCGHGGNRIVIHSGNEGVISQGRLQAQVDVLNEAYAGCTDEKGVDTRLRFTMQGPRYAPVYRDNAQWYTGCGDFGAIDDAILSDFINHPSWDGTRVVRIVPLAPISLLDKF